MICHGISRPPNFTLVILYQPILKKNFFFFCLCCSLKDPSLVNQTISKSLKFLFVRHPLQRLVSTYRNKLENSHLHSDGEGFYRKYGKVIVEKYRGNRSNSTNSDKFSSNVLDEGEADINNNDFSKSSTTKQMDLLVLKQKNTEKTQGKKNADEFTSRSQTGMQRVMKEDEGHEAGGDRREPTFQEFVDYLIDTDVTDYEKHWKPIVLLCHLCEFDFDYIIKYEYFKTEIDYFTQLLQERGLLPSNFQLQWENRGDTDDTTTADYLGLLSKDKLQQLYDKYSLDFIYFDYERKSYDD